MKTPVSEKWIELTPGLDRKPRRVLPAWHVYTSVNGACVLLAPVWVTEINRLEGFVRWRVPNQPYDVERVAPFSEIHSTLEAALEHVGRAAAPLATIPPNVLLDQNQTTAKAA